MKEAPPKRPPDLAVIVVETALDAYRDALLSAATGAPGLDDATLRTLLDAVRPSVPAVLELARPHIPTTTPTRPSRRARRAHAALARKSR